MTITRKEAKSKNITRYFTGKECKYGHISERMVASGRCCECDKLIQKTDAYREKRRAYEQREYMREKRAIYNKLPDRKKSLSDMQKRSYAKNKIAFLFRLLVSRMPKKIQNSIIGCSTVEKLGYSLEDFKKHIESKFKDGMTWENHGLWHIDHIKPVSKFKVLTYDDAKKINELKNLQPLWAKENLSKGDRYFE